jgi:hypothetical protein
MWIFALPLYLRMDYVLTLWLKELPEYVVLFTKLSIIEVLITSICYPLATAARSPGKMKTYELSLGTLQLCIFFGSFVWIKFFNGHAETVYYVTIIITALMFIFRLIILKSLINLSILGFVKIVCLPVFIVMVVSAVPSYFLNKLLGNTFIYFCIVVLVSFILSTITMYFFGLSKNARKKVREVIERKLSGK